MTEPREQDATGEPDATDRLRARIAELETRLAVAEHPDPEPARGTSRRAPVVSALLVVLACLLAPLTVTAVWARTQISDTDQFVETVAPLAQDAGVQAAIGASVTEAITTSLNVDEIASGVLAALAQREDLPPAVALALPGLAAPIADGIEGFVRSQVDRFITSPEFATTWSRASRAAHTQVVTLLEGTPGGVLSAQGDVVTVNLAPVIAQVKERLVANGFAAADRVPEIERSFVLFQSDALVSTQRAYRLLGAAAAWLPIMVLLTFVGGVLLARRRRETLVRGAVGVLASMLVLGLGLLVARALYLRALQPGGLSPETAETVFDILVRSLRDGLRATAVLALVVAVIAYLAGPSRSAVWTRSILRRISSGRTGPDGVVRDFGQPGAWVRTHRRLLQVATFVVGAAVLVFQTTPSAGGIVVVAVVCLVVLGVIEILAVAPAAGAVSPPRGDPRAVP